MESHGHDYLLAAAARGDLFAVEGLIYGGFDVNQRGRDGWTPLMEAAWNRRPQVVDLLLKKGADPTISNEDGFTALMYADVSGDEKIIGLLKEAEGRWPQSLHGE